MIVMRMVQGVRRHLATRWIEWVLAATMAVYGFRLSDDSAAFATSHIYRFMADVGSEALWSRLALWTGALWLIALMLNGTFAPFARASPWVRSLSAFAAAGVWLCLAYGAWRANPHGTAVCIGGLGLLSLAVSLITAQEVGHADKTVRNHAATRKS